MENELNENLKQEESYDDYVKKLDLLIEAQKQESHKQRKVQRFQSWLLVALVAIFAIGMFSLNFTVNRAVANVPQLVDSAQKSVTETTEQIQDLIAEVDSIDFKKLNNTIEQVGESLNSIDVEGLNESIQALEKVSKGLSSIFGR